MRPIRHETIGDFRRSGRRRWTKVGGVWLWLLAAGVLALSGASMPLSAQLFSAVEIAGMKADYKRRRCVLPLKIRNWSSSAACCSGIRRRLLRLGKTRLCHLSSARAGLGGERSAQPQRFRQTHLAQIADADRRRSSARWRAERLGRSQRHARGAGEIVDRFGIDVDARNRNASEGRDHRGAHPRAS